MSKGMDCFSGGNEGHPIALIGFSALQGVGPPVAVSRGRDGNSLSSSLYTFASSDCHLGSLPRSLVLLNSSKCDIRSLRILEGT